MRRGVYRTIYGTAYVSGPKAKRAYDLDMGEYIPMSLVTSERIRDAEDSDEPDSR